MNKSKKTAATRSKIKVTDVHINKWCPGSTDLVDHHETGDFDGLVIDDRLIELLFTFSINHGQVPTTDEMLANAFPSIFCYVNETDQNDWLGGKAHNDYEEFFYVMFMTDAVLLKVLCYSNLM